MITAGDITNNSLYNYKYVNGVFYTNSDQGIYSIGVKMPFQSWINLMCVAADLFFYMLENAFYIQYTKTEDTISLFFLYLGQLWI